MKRNLNCKKKKSKEGQQKKEDKMETDSDEIDLNF